MVSSLRIILAIVNYFQKCFESYFKVTHLKPPRYLFSQRHTPSCFPSHAIFQNNLKYVELFLHMNLTQLIKTLCQLELSHTHNNQNTTLYQHELILSTWFRDLMKVVLKQHIMLMVTTSIKTIHHNNVMGFLSVEPSISIHIFMSISDVHKYRNLNI